MLFLQQNLLGNALQQWLIAIGIAVAVIMAVGLIRSLAVRRLAALASRTANSIDDLLVFVIRKTHLLLVWLPAFWIAGHSLELPDRLDVLLKGTASLAMVLQAGLWMGGAIDFWIAKSRARALQENAGAATSLGALNFIAKVALWTMLLLLGLDNLGVDVTAMVAGLGVGGIAVALAVQNILGDLFASLSIVIDKPFVIGDFIIVDDCLGSVEHVGLKTTRIRSLGGEQLIFANSDLLKARVRNYKRMQERRIVFKFGILHETPSSKLADIASTVTAIIKQQALVRFDRAHFAAIGESAYEFEVVYWMLDPDYNKYMDTQQAINIAMVQAFEKDDISFAYPARMLHLAEPLNLRLPSGEVGAPPASGAQSVSRT